MSKLAKKSILYVKLWNIFIRLLDVKEYENSWDKGNITL